MTAPEPPTVSWDGEQLYAATRSGSHAVLFLDDDGEWYREQPVENLPADAVRLVPDTGPPPLDFDLLVRSIVDSRYMWISMENAVDMAVTTARLLVDAAAVVIVADGQPIEVHGSLGAMRRLVHSRGITADERDHDVAVSRPAPPLEGRERDRLREVLDAAGLPRDRGWDDVLLALRSMGARAVPDTGQAREPERTGRFAEMAGVIDEVIAHYKSYNELDEDWLRETARRLRLAASEPSRDTVQAPDVAEPRVVTVRVTNHGPWHGQRAVVALDEQGNPPAELNIKPDRSITDRSGHVIGHLLGTDATPESHA